MIVFSYYAFSFLAPWQLGKNERLVERNERITEAFAHDPRPIGDVVHQDGTFSPEDEWSRVVATGRFEDQDVLLRLRPIDRTPAFQVLTPFTVTGGSDAGQTVLVNRGWVPAEDSTQVPVIQPAPSNEVTITALVLGDEGVHPSAPLSEQGYDMVYSISTKQVGEILGEDLASPYLQVLAGSPGELTAIPLPQLETGNHLSYGLQWILFGLAAPAGLIYFLYADSRERRRFKEEQEQLLLDAPSTGAGPDPAADAPAETNTAPRSRYGSSRTNYWAKAYDKEAER